MRHNFYETDDFTEDMPFGEFIRKKRRLLGLNQSDFGEMLEVGQGTISQWELGETSPPFEDARKIIMRLGAEVVIDNKMIGIPECPFGWNPYQE